VVGTTGAQWRPLLLFVLQPCCRLFTHTPTILSFSQQPKKDAAAEPAEAEEEREQRRHAEAVLKMALRRPGEKVVSKKHFIQELRDRLRNKALLKGVMATEVSSRVRK
jgi:hypothetical protein